MFEQTLPVLAPPFCKIHTFANLKLCIAVTSKPIMEFQNQFGFRLYQWSGEGGGADIL